MTNDLSRPGGAPAGAFDDIFTPERIADVRSGDRDRVKRAIAGLPRPLMADWLATEEGESVLRDAVSAMPNFYLGNTIDDESHTARWKIRREPAAPIEFDVEFTPEGCTVGPVAAGKDADVTMTLDAVSFAEMASRTKSGMDMLLEGQLHIQGDVQVAMMMEALFGLAES